MQVLNVLVQLMVMFYLSNLVKSAKSKPRVLCHHLDVYNVPYLPMYNTHLFILKIHC
jgi:hypothetical protein